MTQPKRDTPEWYAERAAAERIAQGLPPKIEDRSMLRAGAELLRRSALQRQRDAEKS